MKVNTVLFDLDGTLLPMNTDKFIEIYFNEMGKYFLDLINPKDLVSAVWKATNITISNLESKTNEEVFMSNFAKLIKGDIEDYKKRFDTFYEEVFVKTKEAVIENDLIKKISEILKDKGYQLVIATNPIFPYKAIQQRIEWTGLKQEDFSYISHYELNHYCKPQLKFYEEILEGIGKEPEECLMVGNDVQEDLIAGKLGMKTYLINDHMLHRNDEEIVADYIGSYEDFYSFVKDLPKVK